MAALYRGTVTHQRLVPTRHGFAYEVFMLLLDLDELPQALGGGAWWPLAAVNRRAVATFREADHLVNVRRPGEPLAQAVRALPPAPPARATPRHARSRTLMRSAAGC